MGPIDGHTSLPTDRRNSTLFHSLYSLPRALTHPSISFSSLAHASSPHRTPHHPSRKLTDPHASTLLLVCCRCIQYVATGSALHTPSPCLVFTLCASSPCPVRRLLMHSHCPLRALVRAPHGCVISCASTPPFARYFHPYMRSSSSMLLALATHLMHPVLCLHARTLLVIRTSCISAPYTRRLHPSHAASAPSCIIFTPYVPYLPFAHCLRPSRAVFALCAVTTTCASSLVLSTYVASYTHLHTLY
jgi:hypothetical protein